MGVADRFLVRHPHSYEREPMGSFTIGRLAAAAGVHVETVRYYERRGLIHAPPRPSSGYRQYSAEDLWRLQFVRRGKELGFTLAEIGDLLGVEARSGRSVAHVMAAAQAKVTAIDQRFEELARTRCRLVQLMELCRDGNDTDCVALRLGRSRPQGSEAGPTARVHGFIER